VNAGFLVMKTMHRQLLVALLVMLAIPMLVRGGCCTGPGTGGNMGGSAGSRSASGAVGSSFGAIHICDRVVRGAKPASCEKALNAFKLPDSRFASLKDGRK
jgi:hypothetical protein